MSSLVTVELFAEDRAHEALLRPLIRRVCDEEGKPAEVRVRSARGGHGRAISEFEAYQQLKQAHRVELTGDVLDVTIDDLRGRVVLQETIDGVPYKVVWFYWYYEDGGERDQPGWRRVPVPPAASPPSMSCTSPSATAPTCPPPSPSKNEPGFMN